MTCYDCSQEGRQTPLVALCTSCGLGACARHVRVASPSVTRLVGVGTRMTVPAPRRATCVTCSRVGVGK
ncbi:DUF2180 family protein [Streptomyces sp. NPDC059740]|uniref:DUF2180 family protein n=1 Tax=Streptomyces sp. NPDC059740 TaxID=3346926 RepID=UPI00365DB4B2